MIKAIIFDFFGVVFIRKKWDWKVDDELMGLVAALSERYRIGLLSNSSQASAKSILEAAGRIELFDEIIISSEVGFSKPQIEIFELALKRLGTKPEETVFVDDNPIHVEAAKSIGIISILYQNPAALKSELAKVLA